MRIQCINFLNSKQFDQWFHVHDIYCENKWNLFIFIVLSHNVSLMRKCKYFCHARNYVEYGVGWGMGGSEHTPFLENSNLLNTIHTVQIHVLETATNQLESKVTHVSHVASSNCHPTRGVGVVLEVFSYAHAWSTVNFSMMKH